MDLADQQKHEAASAYERGVAAQGHGRLDEAVRAWRSALALDQTHESARYNLAVALSLSGEEKEAEEQYRKLLTLVPQHRNALFNLANLKHRQENYDEAAALYRQLVAINPEDVSSWINLAKTCAECSDFAEAEKFLTQALRFDPENIIAHWNLSHALLAQGKWGEAWHEYEWRLKLPHWLQPPVNAPAWDAQSKARRILLWNDQGIGDAIQFLRYVRSIASPDREISVLVQDNLKTLAATAPGVTYAYGASDPLPEFDAQASLLSLPHLLSLDKSALSGSAPYLKASRIMDLPKKKNHKAIGLVWAGNQQFEKNSRRSMPIHVLLPLLETPDADWFSLQVGEAATHITQNNLSDRIVDLSPRLHDFADTASAIAALDLVICVDTSVAHLAGALNVPCWIMLPASPDWRWRGQGTDSLWYPSVRLFHQQQVGDWRSVVADIARELRKTSRKF